MALKVFKLEQGSEQHQFFACQEPIGLYTGGFNNGKTAALAVLAVRCASEYKDGRYLVGRATRPKLEDSTKPELLKWLPADYVDKWPNDRWNNIRLKTGSTIEFRHVRQEGKGKGEEQSNLLSATYDGIFIDQMDDPEFSYKDFEDLIGRLRGEAVYIGDDPKMPRNGPRWFRGTANPTRNWLYRDLVHPYFVFRDKGFVLPNLIYHKRTAKPAIKVFNAPSGAHRPVESQEHVELMDLVMRGSHKKRFIAGLWDAYEGLIYPDYDTTVHGVESKELASFIEQKLIDGEVGIIEAYDYGQVSPSCYLLAFVDDVGNVLIADGFYEPNKTVKQQAKLIKQIRLKWKIVPKDRIFADPAIFKNVNAKVDKVGDPISQMFSDEGIEMQRGANAIDAGIQKVSTYVQVDKEHKHPITKNYGAPRLFVNMDLNWFDNEIVDYYWNKNTTGQNVDKPKDVNDHAMDALRYLFTKRPSVIGMVRASHRQLLPAQFYAWNEMPDRESIKLLPRHMM